MAYRHTIDATTYVFADLRELLAKATPFRSGDRLAGVAATSADTFVSIGRQSLPIFVAVRYETAAEIAPQVAAYRTALASSAEPVRGGVFLRVPAYIAATDAQARTEAEPSLIHFYRQQAALLADSAKRAGVDGAERRAQTARRLETMTYEEALKANRVDYQGYVYDGAQHGFNNDTTPRYDEAAAKLAWQRTTDWFNKYLRSS